MAKRRRRAAATKVRTQIVRAPAAARPIVIRQSAPSLARRAGRRVRHTAGRVGAAAHAAFLNQERTGAMIGAALLGILDKQGTALPTVPVLGRAGTAGLALWWLGRSNKSAQLQHAATGCLSIAMYELLKEGKIAGAGDFSVVGGMSTV